MLFGFDHIRPDLRSLIPVGFFQAFLGRSWQLCSSCGRLVLLLEPDTSWQCVVLLIAFGIIWQIFVVAGSSWYLLAALGIPACYLHLLYFWSARGFSGQFFVAPCSSWQLLAVHGSSWHLSVYMELCLHLAIAQTHA